jgi:hypothetical protein
LRGRSFQPPIGGNPPFPCPKNEGGSTITAELFPKHGQVVVRKKRATEPQRFRKKWIYGFSRNVSKLFFDNLSAIKKIRKNPCSCDIIEEGL